MYMKQGNLAIFNNAQVYIMGFDMGAMMPCFMSTRGFVLSWNVSLVCHSGPTGSLRERSYCSLDSKGWGSWDER